MLTTVELRAKAQSLRAKADLQMDRGIGEAYRSLARTCDTMERRALNLRITNELRAMIDENNARHHTEFGRRKPLNSWICEAIVQKLAREKSTN